MTRHHKEPTNHYYTLNLVWRPAMEFVPLLAFVAILVKKVVDFIRYVKAGDRQSRWAALTQVAAWVAGIAVVMLAAHTAWAHTTVIMGVKLAATGIADQIWLGLQAGSVASLVADVIAAHDNTRSSQVPSLSASPADRP
jgi:uncharacterized membrane protein